MADKTQLAMLKSGVNAWNAWRTAHADFRPELSEVHLYGLDLIGIDLSGADLSKADLRGANLSDAILIGANLEGANFFKVVLDRADLSGANLIDAHFLSVGRLVAARNWQSTYRALDLACGAPIPQSHARL
jgi:Pentapeptide repeats (8 copies)